MGQALGQKTLVAVGTVTLLLLAATALAAGGDLQRARTPIATIASDRPLDSTTPAAPTDVRPPALDPAIPGADAAANEEDGGQPGRTSAAPDGAPGTRPQRDDDPTPADAERGEAADEESGDDDRETVRPPVRDDDDERDGTDGEAGRNEPEGDDGDREDEGADPDGE